MSEKRPQFFHNDSHGAAVERNNRPFNQPTVSPHEDEVVLQEARKYVLENDLDNNGYLIVERSGSHYCWAIKIRGATRWLSRAFSLTSGQYGLGDTQPLRWRAPSNH